MSLLVLFSTVSFTVEKHFCGTTLIDTAVFTEAQKCGMEMTSSVKKSCCKDELEVVKGQDDLKLSKFEELPAQQQFTIKFLAYSFLNRFDAVEKAIIPHKNYSPPNLVADIQLLDQVFIV